LTSPETRTATRIEPPAATTLTVARSRTPSVFASAAAISTKPRGYRRSRALYSRLGIWVFFMTLLRCQK